MKERPGVTIDGRGVVVHLVDSDGRGIDVPLNEVPARVARVAGALKSREGRSTLLRGVFRLLGSLAEPEEQRSNATDDGRKADR